MPRKPTTRCRFYVYDLIDPRTDEVFYVGLGTGDRHIKSARDIGSGRKKHMISDLRQRGLKPVSRIVFAFKTRGEAAMFEEQRHRQFGLEYSPAFVPVESKRRPLEAWCGHPTYDRICRFLPRYCVPSWIEPDQGTR